MELQGTLHQIRVWLNESLHYCEWASVSWSQHVASSWETVVTVKENVEVLSQLVTWVKGGAQVRVTVWERRHCKYLIVRNAWLSGTTCTKIVDSFFPKISQINQYRLLLLLVVMSLVICMPEWLCWAVLHGRWRKKYQRSKRSQRDMFK